MFGKNNKEVPSYHTETRFLDKDLGSDCAEMFQLLAFYKIWCKTGTVPTKYKASCYFRKIPLNSATFKVFYKLIILI